MGKLFINYLAKMLADVMRRIGDLKMGVEYDPGKNDINQRCNVRSWPFSILVILLPTNLEVE